MRGTLIRKDLPMAKTGIIPAYAGNTDILLASFSFDLDHPRVCGEHPRKYWVSEVD